MIKLTQSEFRKLWIDFFEKKKHLFVPARSLVPENDPTLLFVNSGVATLKSYFSGEIEPPSKRIVNIQKLIRTNDIENVGKTSRHHTMFEMMGNFSIGDYFKKEAIQFGYEFLVDKLKIDPKKLYFTVFKEDNDAYNYWLELGIEKSHIIKCDRDRNFWDIGSGPCGPCTEIYYDRGSKYDPKNLGEKLFLEDIENDRYIEIWNIVFSEFNNDGKNNYTPLLQKNIDTGAGFERILAISQDVPTNFDTDLFFTIIDKVQKLSNHKYNIQSYFKNDEKQRKINLIYKIIADHARAIVLALSDGVIFDNKGQGYVIRKLMRRVIGLAKILEIEHNFAQLLVDGVIETLGTFYTNVAQQKTKILNLMNEEYELFSKTLNHSWKILEDIIANSDGKTLDAYQVFKLIETYGFTKELLDEILEQKNLTYSKEQFDKYFEEHKQISKKTKFAKGMKEQNNHLLNFDQESIFDYFADSIKDAKVIALFDENWNPVNQLNNQNGFCILDKTCLYALSGGQEEDEGTINGFNVLSVNKAPKMQNVHEIENATLKLNQTVEVKHNVKRRAQLARQHSSEHLLHAALKHNIDKQIKQEGAYKAEHKISLDFRFHRKLDSQELEVLENYVNKKIAEKHPVQISFVNLEEAKEKGASAYFEDKYKKQTGKLRLIEISAQSLELCGGTHVKNTSEIQEFIILNLETKGAGLWRIEALSGHQAIENYLIKENDLLQKKVEDQLNILKSLNISQEIIKQKLNEFNFSKNIKNFRQNKDLYVNLENFVLKQKTEFAQNNAKNFAIDLLKKYQEIDSLKGLKLIELNDKDAKEINKAINSFFNELNNGVLLIINSTQSNNQYFLAASKKVWLDHKSSANEIVQEFSKLCNSRGGGRLEVAQGSFEKNTNKNLLIEFIQKKIN